MYPVVYKKRIRESFQCVHVILHIATSQKEREQQDVELCSVHAPGYYFTNFRKVKCLI